MHLHSGSVPEWLLWHCGLWLSAKERQGWWISWLRKELLTELKTCSASLHDDTNQSLSRHSFAKESLRGTEWRLERGVSEKPVNRVDHVFLFSASTFFHPQHCPASVFIVLLGKSKLHYQCFYRWWFFLADRMGCQLKVIGRPLRSANKRLLADRSQNM